MLMSNASRGHDTDLEDSRDKDPTLICKIVAILAILLAGVCGVAIPLVGKKKKFLEIDSNLFVAAKAFVGGVILAIGFVLMLPDATASLINPCLPEIPWSKSQFSGFIVMMAALGTLLIEFVGTQYYERKQEKMGQNVPVNSDGLLKAGLVPSDGKGSNVKVFGEEESGAIHIVGIHAHAAHHKHCHPQEHGLVPEI